MGKLIRRLYQTTPHNHCSANTYPNSTTVTGIHCNNKSKSCHGSFSTTAEQQQQTIEANDNKKQHEPAAAPMRMIRHASTTITINKQPLLFPTSNTKLLLILISIMSILVTAISFAFVDSTIPTTTTDDDSQIVLLSSTSLLPSNRFLLQQRRTPAIRKHTFLYNNNDDETATTIRTIWVAPPHQMQRRRRLTYHPEIDDATPPITNSTGDDDDDDDDEDIRPVAKVVNHPIPGTDEGRCFPEDERFDTEIRPCHPIVGGASSNDKQIATRRNDYYQTCNNLHELDSTSSQTGIQFIACGGTRCAFLVTTDNSSKFVLKTLQLAKHFTGTRYRAAVKDSMALERLSASPYAITMHASCSLSKIVDYSNGGNLHDLFKRTRIAEYSGGGDEIVVNAAQKSPEATINETARTNETTAENETHFIAPSEREHRYLTPSHYNSRHLLTTPLTKLKIAYQLTTAVADMHAVEDHPDGLPRMVHNDLCCHQFVLIDGVYQLGDFDSTTFVTVRDAEEASSSTTGMTNSSLRGTLVPPQRQQVRGEVTCQTTPVYEYGHVKLLAPEQLPFYDDTFEHPPRVYRDKLDVFQLGNLCYTLLTNLYIWEGFRTTPALMATYHGARPAFPDDLLTSSNNMTANDNEAITAVKEMILMAWTENPLERPSARTLSNHLYTTIAKIEDGDDDVIRIRNDPLPPNYRFTGSDFRKHRRTP